MSTREVQAAAMKLSPKVRARLAEKLMASLDEPALRRFDAEWAEECEVRIDSVDAGETKPIPLGQVLRKLQGGKRRRAAR